jgi:hypothetical protein
MTAASDINPISVLRITEPFMLLCGRNAHLHAGVPAKLRADPEDADLWSRLREVSRPDQESVIARSDLISSSA